MKANLKSVKALTFERATSLLTLRYGVRDLKIFAERNIFFFLTKGSDVVSLRVIVLDGTVLRVKAKRCGGTVRGSERSPGGPGKWTKGEVDFAAARDLSRRRGETLTFSLGVACANGAIA